MRRSVQVAFVACVVLVVAGGAIGGGAIGGGGGGGGGGGPFLKLDSSNDPLTGGLCVTSSDGEEWLVLPKSGDSDRGLCSSPSSTIWQIGTSGTGAGRVRSYETGGKTRTILQDNEASVSAAEPDGTRTAFFIMRPTSMSFTYFGDTVPDMYIPYKISNNTTTHGGRLHVDDEMEVAGALRAASFRSTATTTTATRVACNASNVGMQTMYDDGNDHISLCVCEQTGSGTYSWGGGDLLRFLLMKVRSY